MPFERLTGHRVIVGILEAHCRQFADDWKRYAPHVPALIAKEGLESELLIYRFFRLRDKEDIDACLAALRQELHQVEENGLRISVICRVVVELRLVDIDFDIRPWNSPGNRAGKVRSFFEIEMPVLAWNESPASLL